MEALKQGLSEVSEIARAVYPRNLRKGLRQAAERNVAAHLEKLRAQCSHKVPLRYRTLSLAHHDLRDFLRGGQPRDSLCYYAI